jgi:hypothetical protein
MIPKALARPLTLAFIVWSVAACSTAPEEHIDLKEALAPMDPIPAGLREQLLAGPPPKGLGTWTIVHHLELENSAMSKAEAEQWIGKTVHYGDDTATFGSDTCVNVDYSGRTIDRAQFFKEFHVKWDTLGGVLQDARVVRVSCGGVPWKSPGGTVLITQKTFIVAAGDGVFFQLATPGFHLPH